MHNAERNLKVYIMLKQAQPAAPHSGAWCSEGTGMANSSLRVFTLQLPAAYLLGSLQQPRAQDAGAGCTAMEGNSEQAH